MEPQETDFHRQVFSRIGYAMTLMIVIQQLGVMGLGALMANFFPGAVQTGWYAWVVLYAPLYLLAFPVFLLVMKFIPDSEKPDIQGASSEDTMARRISLGGMIRLVIAAIGIVYPFHILTAYISFYLQQATGQGIENGLGTVVGASNPWINIIFVAAIAPVMEEILFRRILYHKLIRFGGKVYMVFSALVFSLFHVNPYQMVYAFLLGLVFAYLTLYTGTIRYSIILHVAINLIGSGISPLLMEYAGTGVIAVWGSILIIAMLVGLITNILWMFRGRKTIVFPPGAVALPNKRITVLNGGMILYLALVALLVALILAG